MNRETHARFCERLKGKLLRPTHQGRFKSQALLDEAGLLTAMVYVDLNPVRAGAAASPEEYEFTSICQRIRELRTLEATAHHPNSAAAKVPLMQLQCPGAAHSIPYPMDQYLDLVDWTSRAVRNEKHRSIDGNLPPLIDRLSINAEAWRLAMRPRGNVFGRALGRLNHMRLHAKTLGQSWVRGLRQAERTFG